MQWKIKYIELFFASKPMAGYFIINKNRLFLLWAGKLLLPPMRVNVYFAKNAKSFFHCY
jgi:hypothetical protein